MPILRFPCLVVGLFCAASCFAQASQATVPGQTPPAATGDKPPVLTPSQTLMQAAVTRLKQMEPLEVRFHFRSFFSSGLPIEQQGRCVTAAGRKVRYELHVKQGSLETASFIVSDGTQHHRWIDLEGKRHGKSLQWSFLDEAKRKGTLDTLGPDLKARLERELDQELGVSGVLTPFHDLLSRLELEPTVGEATIIVPDRGTVPVQVLRGGWNRKVLDKVAAPKPDKAPKGDPDYAELWNKRIAWIHYPRRCVIYLDKATGLPLRLEWFGPQRREGDEVLLLRQDFSVIRALPATDAALLFTLTEDEKKSVDFKAISPDELRAYLDLYKKVMQDVKKSEEDELSRQRALELERDK